MDRNRRSGVVTGVLLIGATAAGLLTLPAQHVLAASDYLTGISLNEPRILLAALLTLIMGWCGAGIGISMYPVLREHGHGLALGAAGFRIMEGIFHSLGGACLFLLTVASRELLRTGPAGVAQIQGLGDMLLEGRSWLVGVPGIFSWCIGAFIYYSLFYKARLVPRWLSVWGLAGLTLAIVSHSLFHFRVIADLSPVQMGLDLPIALQEMVLAVWLIVRGFNSKVSALPEKKAA